MKQQPRKEKKIHKEKVIQQSKKTKNDQEEPQEAPKNKLKNNLQHLPTIQNMNEIPQNQRVQKTTQYFALVKPFLVAFMQKKLGSRVLQYMLNWGDINIKNYIYQCVIKNWKDLIKSKYSLFVIIKISKDYDLPGVIDDFILLQNSKEGATIIQNFISKNPESQGVRKIKEKIDNLHQKCLEGDIKSQQVLHNLSLKSIEKNYYFHTISEIILKYSLGTLFPEQKQKVLQFLITNITQIVTTDQGVRLCIELINRCNPKQKKTLIKAYKGNISQIVKLTNNSYVTIMKLITQVDDTVLVQKSLLPQIEELFVVMSENKKAYNIVFSLFSQRNHNFNVLGKYEHKVEFTQCKKTEQVRKSQLRKHLYDPLLAFLKQEGELQKLLRNHINNKLILGIIKSMQEDAWKPYKQFVSSIADYFLTETKSAIKNNVFDGCITADGSANKIIKNILLLNEQFIDYYCDEFSKIIVSNLTKFLSTKASFILLGLIEKGGRDYLAKQVKNCHLKVDQIVAGEHYRKFLNSKK